MPDSAYEQGSIDWDDLYKRLCELANRLVARAPIDMAAEDLAQEIVKKFLMSQSRFLMPDTRDLTAVLCRALQFEHKSRMRREQLRRHLMAFFIDNSAREQKPAGTAPGDTGIEFQQIRRQLTEPDLEALAETSGGPNENQKLATLLRSTPREVANRKKRLRRRIQAIVNGRRSASGEGVTHEF